METEKKGQLEYALGQIKKRWGPGAIMSMGEESHVQIDTISTGSLSLDMALGIGGVPRGRVVEIYGPESSGKTTLALHIIANAQKQGGSAAIIDAEHALDPIYAQAIGLDLNKIWISQPDYGEQALEICNYLVTSNALDVVVIDSVAALVPKAELEGEMGSSHMGLQARLMSQALRKLTGAIHHSNTCIVFINQLRSKIGVMFGSHETTTGGNALKFYASVRLDVRRGTTLKNGDETVGNRTRVRVVKNKLAPPFKQAEFDILYGKGIFYLGDLIDTALALKIVQRSGAWYSFGSVKLGQGRDKVAQFLADEGKLLKDLEKEVFQKAFPQKHTGQETKVESKKKK